MAGPVSQSTANQAVATRIYEAYALAAPGANTNLVPTGAQFPSIAGLKFSRRASRCRLFIVLTTSSVLNYHVTDGSTAYVNGLNASAALNAGDAYEFEFDVQSHTNGTESGTALVYNFQVETDSVIRQIIVSEITGP